MLLGWTLLILLLVGYFSFAGAIIYHLNIYSFSRPSKWMVNIFLTLAILLALAALFFFALVGWDEIINFYV